MTTFAKRKIKIAIIGVRGIPANYGGFDTFAEELSTRLVPKGFQVIVYCRSNYFKNKPLRYCGVRLVYLFAPRLKAAESLIHSFLSSLHVFSQNIDVIFFVDPANAPFFMLLRLFGKKVIVHTDGLGWKRRKWSIVARQYYKFAELLCTWSANVLVTDNLAMQEYYRKEYSADSIYIPYGADSREGIDENVYEEFNLPRGCYLLVVARLEPENNTDFIIKEYVASRINMPLVVVGDSPYDPGFMNKLRKLANQNVFFLGRVNDHKKLNSLYRNAYLYIHGHEVGGTNPSLLRAMFAGTAPLVIDVAFNKVVIADCGFVFTKRKGCLRSILERLTEDAAEVGRIEKMAKEHVDVYFRWDSVVKEYEKMFRNIAAETL